MCCSFSEMSNPNETHSLTASGAHKFSGEIQLDSSDHHPMSQPPTRTRALVSAAIATVMVVAIVFVAVPAESAPSRPLDHASAASTQLSAGSNKQGFGGTCTDNAGCLSSNCIGGTCCSQSIEASCGGCGDSGSCSKCDKPTQYPFGSTCFDKSEAGQTCYQDDDRCLSGKCAGTGQSSYCCKTDVAASCQQCDGQGDCGSNKQGFGGTCTDNAGCMSSNCIGGTCCSQSIEASCGGCGDSGSCSKCDKPTQYPFGSTCFDKSEAGQTCYQDDDRCLSGKCAGTGQSSYCCKTDVAASCQQCDGQGDCVASPTTSPTETPTKALTETPTKAPTVLPTNALSAGHPQCFYQATSCSKGDICCGNTGKVYSSESTCKRWGVKHDCVWQDDKCVVP
eukprot:TRINITY_DN724_c0_g1_i5.p1 TRINITY_DN724_c0_g1~~TRINITY_DN724_c0_g1_i5.p1  ORF type:complete len:393 (-),score=43.46 TRINITY_DN724_c0_g1_i5:228-1406(-)